MNTRHLVILAVLTFGICSVSPQRLHAQTVVSGYRSLENIRFADGFDGADCGARINAAEADLGSTPGEIWINNACGMSWTTSVVISNNYHLLKFIQGGTYQTSKVVVLTGNYSGIAGLNAALSNNGTAQAYVLKESNSSNLPSLVTMNGEGAFLRDIVLDGNKANNSTEADGVLVNQSAGRTDWANVSIQNFVGNGITVSGTGAVPNACCAKMSKVILASNNNDGMKATYSTDWSLSEVEFENNGGMAWKVWTQGPGELSSAISAPMGLVYM